jgi:hypothetical protein
VVTLAQRRALLTTALGFMQLDWRAPLLSGAVALAGWLNSWSGLGAILVGMTAQGFNVELKEFPSGWRANFYPVGLAHSVVIGSAWEPTPWRAVQGAAWEALTRPRSAAGAQEPGAAV